MTDESKTPNSEEQGAEHVAQAQESAVETKTNESGESQQATQEEEKDAADDVQALLEDARAKADQHFDQLVRLQAEMENLRKRTKRDLESAHKFALENICRELLSVRDSMEMGLQAAETETADIDTIRQGVDLTLKMFVSMMEKFSMLQVNPEKGEKLNPELHQAMSMQEDAEVEPNSILAVVQKGCTLNGRLVRPAMVIVAKAVTTVGNDESKTGDGESKIGTEIDEQA